MSIPIPDLHVHFDFADSCNCCRPRRYRDDDWCYHNRSGSLERWNDFRGTPREASGSIERTKSAFEQQLRDANIDPVVGIARMQEITEISFESHIQDGTPFSFADMASLVAAAERIKGNHSP